MHINSMKCILVVKEFTSFILLSDNYLNNENYIIFINQYAKQ